MAFVLSQSIALLLLNFAILYGEKHKVEARPKEVIALPSWFNSVEGFALPNLEQSQSTEPSYIDRHIENDETLTPLRKKKNKRKRKKHVKKVAKTFQEEDKKKSSERRANKKKKKHRPRVPRLKFIKSDMINNDVKDSNLSKSQEKQMQRKPVDIIVHIKMQE